MKSVNDTLLEPKASESTNECVESDSSRAGLNSVESIRSWDSNCRRPRVLLSRVAPAGRSVDRLRIFHEGLEVRRREKTRPTEHRREQIDEKNSPVVSGYSHGGPEPIRSGSDGPRGNPTGSDRRAPWRSPKFLQLLFRPDPFRSVLSFRSFRGEPRLAAAQTDATVRRPFEMIELSFMVADDDATPNCVYVTVARRAHKRFDTLRVYDETLEPVPLGFVNLSAIRGRSRSSKSPSIR